MTRCVSVIVIACFLSASLCAAEEIDDKTVDLSTAEQEFVALADEFSNELRTYWQDAAEIEDFQERLKFSSEHHPSIEYLPKFLVFEAEHSGEDVGIDALGEIVSYAAHGGLAESPAVKARREVLERLGTYEDRPLVIGSLYRLGHGRYDPLVHEYLRRVGTSQEANPLVSAVGRFVLAKSILSKYQARLRGDARLIELAQGASPSIPDEEERIRNYIASPSLNELGDGVKEAMSILEELAASGESFQSPVIRTVDPTGRIARIDADQSKSASYLAEKAAALLFKEQHLRVGKPFPKLELELVDGGMWSTVANRGKVIVIQFSFTGCGPCERMYPELDELQHLYPERLSILTILRDETDEAATEGIETGKFTWDIALDSKPNRVSSRWAVSSFPTVYVIDPQGHIAAENLRAKALEEQLGKMLEFKD